MADYDQDDLNISNLTETRSRRAPDTVKRSSVTRLGGTRWPAAAGIAVLGSLLLLGFAAWKFARHATRDLFRSDSRDESQ
ncbi:MAG TPA: hypothetical protein VIB79_15840 [Candidatus Binatia bacterium]|jgi:hypothetical protein